MLVEEIQSGAFGTVWEVRTPASASGRSECAKTVQRLEEIATMMLCGRHHNICPVIDFFQPAGEQLWLVIPRLSCSLDDPVGVGGLGLGNLVATAHDVGRGIAHIHKCGVIHGDVKLENILVGPAEEGGRRTLQICDFGSAVRLGSGDIPRGTVAFSAPECFSRVTSVPDPGDDGADDGCTIVGPASDLWGLGCLLWEAATGTRPSNARTILFAGTAGRCPSPAPR